jgi:hypothetical protein
MHAQTPSRDALAPRSELFEHGPDIMRTKQIRRNSLFPPFFEHDLSFFFSAAKLTNPNSLIPPCDLYRSDQNFPFFKENTYHQPTDRGKKIDPSDTRDDDGSEESRPTSFQTHTRLGGCFSR